MKRTTLFLTILLGLSGVSGYLMSKASWIGRVGMTLFYKEYNLLKVWWQGGLAAFIFLLVLFLLHTLIEKKLPFAGAKIVHVLLLAAAGACLYLTYVDFDEDFSHHLLGWRFHYGFYLIWLQWILICFFFLFTSRKKVAPATGTDKKVAATL